MKKHVGKSFSALRPRAYDFSLDDVNEMRKYVKISFIGGRSIALPLYFWMFDRTLDYLKEKYPESMPIGAKPQPPYPKDSIEGEIWKAPKPYPSNYKASPHVLDILVYAGIAEYKKTTSQETGRRVQGARYVHPPRPVHVKDSVPVVVESKGIEDHKQLILDWAKSRKDEIIEARLNYSWMNRGVSECVESRNEISRAIIDSRIRNGGAVDLDTLNKVTRWGFNRDFPLQNEEQVLEYTTFSFGYLDKGDVKNAILTLLDIEGVGISRASKILGLFDQDNLCIYDSRVGYALKNLVINGEHIIKIPPGRSRVGDIGISNQQWAENYEKLIKVLKIIRDYMNENGCTYRLADVEMALFMMGKQ